MYYVYIIQNPSGIFYKGITQNLDKRIIEHNSDESRYTAGKGPWRLVYYREYSTKKTALIEEKRLKRLNKRSLDRLIELFGSSAG